MNSNQNENMIFGPVPSRRLGRSLGINNIPPKICTYACIYCQLGKTIKMQTVRQQFYNPKTIFKKVKEKIDLVRKAGDFIDYLAFVPDGEPTLDQNLGVTIDLLKPLGIKIAIITNASLIADNNVQKELAKADWVSLKIDAADPFGWRKIDHPHRELDIKLIKKGMVQFSQVYSSTLVTETMLIENMNDDKSTLLQTAEFLADFSPHTAYLSIPTRPPAAKWVKPPPIENINMAYQIYSTKLKRVELLTGYEGNAFAFTGNVENDLLSITSVHPMRRDAVEELLNKSGRSWQPVSDLIEQNKIAKIDYQGAEFYMRKF